ncbi:MAG: hypothetical protein CMM01_19290 [Rhodopirellula sp.]|nr:hypothetical protein [Rhodopirellula sp.]OUX49776.1 MAG: hypothetical protein CBE43_09225 [Rhodopirellula sp. TMED283]
MIHSSTSQSSTQATAASVKAKGEHWFDLTATLSRDSREEFGNWLTSELEIIELELSRFSTALSNQQIKSQRK